MAILQLDRERSAGRRSPGGGRMGKQTKFQEVCGRLTDMAHQLGPDAKLPTVLQLRDRLGVSIATLNSVLTELETQRVVRRRHGVGIYVAPDIRQHRVALICDPSFFRVAGTSPFWGLLVEKVRQRAEQEREAFSFHFALEVADKSFADKPSDELGDTNPYLPENMIEDLRAGRVDAVLGVGLPQITADWIERQDIPFVAFAGPGKYIFGLDSNEIIRRGVTHLCEQGCRKIGYWGAISPHRYVSPSPDPSANPVYVETLAANGRAFDPDLVWDNQHLIPAGGGVHTLSHQEQGYHAAMEAFGTHTDRMDWPDGIFSADDMATQGLLTALQRLGIQVGEEIKIATHANAGSPALLGWEDRITRLEVDPAEIVGGMFDTVEDLLHGKEPKAGFIEVKPRLRAMGEL
ncbi:MAG: GntR family transcriptional regulator [Fibrella sp.]|nr:GntR family transcriptional regulator [Armatimonadota bacterium]